MKPSNIIYLFVFILFFGLSENFALPDQDQAIRQITQANFVLKSFTEGNSPVIPKDILNNANAIAIFPRASKFPLFFFIGLYKASGIVIRRTVNGWSAPAFYKLDDVKLEFGYRYIRDDLVLIFKEDSFEGLIDYKFKLGDKEKVTPGSSNPQPNVRIFSYSRFHKFYLNGAVIKQNNPLNKLIYPEMKAHFTLFSDSKYAFDKVSPKVRAEIMGLTNYLQSKSSINSSVNSSSINDVVPVYAILVSNPINKDFNVEYCRTADCTVNNDNNVFKKKGTWLSGMTNSPPFRLPRPAHYWFLWQEQNGTPHFSKKDCASSDCQVECKY